MIEQLNKIEMIEEIVDQLHQVDYETIYRVAKQLNIPIKGYHERLGFFEVKK